MKRDRLKDVVYYHCILSSKPLYTAITQQFFEETPLEYIYALAREYTIKYDQAPTESDMYGYVDRLEMDEDEKSLKYDKDRIHILYTRSNEISQYGREALEDEIRAISKWTVMHNCLGMATTEFRLLDDQVSPDNVDNAVDKIYAAISNRHLPSFDSGESPIVDFWDPASHSSEHVPHWKTGYEFLDVCLDGGYWPGSLHLLLGAPKVGKSMWLCNLAARSSMMGNDTLYVTLEMPTHMLNARLMPNLANIPVSEYKLIRDNKEEVGRYLSLARKKNPVQPGRLDIISYPTNSLSAEHLASRIKEEEEKHGIHYKTVFIDYLSIMISSLKDKSNMYLDGKRKAEEVRSQAQINNWCIVSAVQTNREQYGTSDIDETHVSESTGYNATVDSMFGIIKDEEMSMQSIYRLKNIYDRVAPHQGDSKSFVFDGIYLRITEHGEIMHSSDKMAHQLAMRRDASVLNPLNSGVTLQGSKSFGFTQKMVEPSATIAVGQQTNTDETEKIIYSHDIMEESRPNNDPEMEFSSERVQFEHSMPQDVHQEQQYEQHQEQQMSSSPPMSVVTQFDASVIPAEHRAHPASFVMPAPVNSKGGSQFRH